MVEKARPEPATQRGERAGNGKASRLERQLEAAQQIAHLGSWEWRVAAARVSWSDELYRIYGLEPGSCEITFESFLSRVHPEDRDNTARQVRTALETGRRFAFDERIVRPDGSIRVLESKGEVVRNADGAAEALIGTCRDITEERERDEQLRRFADIVRNIQISLTVWSMKGETDGRSARLVSCNPAAEAIGRIPLASRIGCRLEDVVPHPANAELAELVAAVHRESRIRNLPSFRVQVFEGRPRVLALKAFPLPGDSVGLATEDVTEQVRARDLQAAEHGILELIASALPLREVLADIVRRIEEFSPGAIGSILLLDDDGVTLRHGVAPSLPDAFNRALDGLAIGERAGSCGTAMYRKEPVYVHDIESDPLWDGYRELTRPYGLRACWSTPVLAKDGRVLGSFAVYYEQPRSPAEEDLALLARASRLTAIAIERQQLEDQLRALSAHVESVREEERTAIAREIHDELGQSLTALKMDLAWMGRRAAEPTGLDNTVAIERVKSLSQMTDAIIDEVRDICAKLRPGVLDDLGLAAAVEWQAHNFEEHTGTQCTISSNLGDERLEGALSTAVFRILQEALTNVARHAAAKRVDVHLVGADGWLTLDVEDDGRGITQASIASPKSLGLIGMRERARRLGGTVTIGAGPGGGTVLSLRLPLGAPGGEP